MEGLPMDPLDVITLMKSENEKNPSLLLRIETCESHIKCNDTSYKKELTFILEETKKNDVNGLKILDENNWQGCCLPPALFMKEIPHLLYRGPGGFSVPPNHIFNVRGKDYLDKHDHHSLKVPSKNPLFYLRGVQIIRTENLEVNIALNEWCGYPKHKHDNEWLLLNFMIPCSFNIQIVCLFTASREALEVIRETAASSSSNTSNGNQENNQPSNELNSNIGWKKSLRNFWKADKSYCDSRFKLIPSIVEGPWAIKLAVGHRPALIGNKKLNLTYTRGPGYLEVGIDISSSTLATRILKLVQGGSKRLEIDLGVVIQGEDIDELPERMLGQARFSNVDFDHASNI
jgi:hypothetical protein